jgi:FkbM family methyltransferase
MRRLWLRRPSGQPSGDRATEADIYYAYRLILQREPDPEGLAHYRRLVAEGLSLDRLVRSFVNSDEYRFRQDAERRPTPVDLGGYQVCVEPRDTDFAQAILATRDYEPHVRRVVRDHLRAGDVFVDVGANVGAVAFLAATIVGPAGRVLAVEPNPDNLQLLYRGILLNRFTHVEVLPYAASDRRGVFALTGGTSNTHVVGPRAADEPGLFVQAVALDEALAHLPRVDFVKMDIEGHEPQAFDGFRRTIARDRPTLLVEFNPRCLVDLQRQDPVAYLERLFALYPRARVISHWGDDRTFDRAVDLMAYWERRNREVTAAGLLPDRLLHFDLVLVRA